MGTRGKINVIWWNIKINLQKIGRCMWIWIANKSAKFHAKRLNQSENVPKSFRRATFFSETPCRMIGLWWRNYDNMFSCFHRIMERNRQTDSRRTDGQTDRIAFCWRAIKTVQWDLDVLNCRYKVLVTLMHLSSVRWSPAKLFYHFNINAAMYMLLTHMFANYWDVLLKTYGLVVLRQNTPSQLQTSSR